MSVWKNIDDVLLLPKILFWIYMVSLCLDVGSSVYGYHALNATEKNPNVNGIISYLSDKMPLPLPIVKDLSLLIWVLFGEISLIFILPYYFIKFFGIEFQINLLQWQYAVFILLIIIWGVYTSMWLWAHLCGFSNNLHEYKIPIGETLIKLCKCV